MVNCHFCEEEITSDRYEFSLKGQRQDFPPDGEWQNASETFVSDCCSTCYNKVAMYYRGMVGAMKSNKGNPWPKS